MQKDDCRPLDKVIVDSHQNLIVQKILITTSRAELHCIKDDTGELKKSIQTKKKLKKALGEIMNQYKGEIKGNLGDKERTFKLTFESIVMKIK